MIRYVYRCNHARCPWYRDEVTTLLNPTEMALASGHRLTCESCNHDMKFLRIEKERREGDEVSVQFMGPPG